MKNMACIIWLMSIISICSNVALYYLTNVYMNMACIIWLMNICSIWLVYASISIINKCLYYLANENKYMQNMACIIMYNKHMQNNIWLMSIISICSLYYQANVVNNKYMQNMASIIWANVNNK